MSDEVQHLAKSFMDTVAGRMRRETEYHTPKIQLGRIVAARGVGAPVVAIGKERLQRQSYRVAKSVPLANLKRGDEVLMMETWVGTVVMVALIRTDRDRSDRTGKAAKTQHVQIVGDGSDTSFVIEHDMGTRDLSVSIWDTGTNRLHFDKHESITATSADAITVVFETAPTNKQYRIVIK
jgi:hypothetical protein